MDLSYLKNYIYEAPREPLEPSYQEKSDIYKSKGNKVYEHIKKEIDSRSKKVKSSEKNSNTYQVNPLFATCLCLYNITDHWAGPLCWCEQKCCRCYRRPRHQEWCSGQEAERKVAKLEICKVSAFIFFLQKAGGSRQWRGDWFYDLSESCSVWTEV